VVMNLMLDAAVKGDTAVVTCRGPIVHGTTARRFRACIKRLLRRYRRVVVDLGTVTHIDARGIGMLAVLIAQARSADRRLVLARSSDRVERILRLTRLDVELHNDSVRDRSARPAEADEDRGVLEQAVVRTHVGPYEAQTAPEERASEGRADCMA
jgi:anti-anti-sigma factor